VIAALGGVQTVRSAPWAFAQTRGGIRFRAPSGGIDLRERESGTFCHVKFTKEMKTSEIQSM
jgi:hypothetical protein